MTFDKDALMEHFEGDTEIIEELIEVFEMSYPETLDSLQEAITESDSKSIELHAHTLKGMLSNFFAAGLKDKAFRIEQMGKNSSLTEAKEIYEEISVEMPCLINDLKKMAA